MIREQTEVSHITEQDKSEAEKLADKIELETEATLHENLEGEAAETGEDSVKAPSGLEENEDGSKSGVDKDGREDVGSVAELVESGDHPEGAGSEGEPAEGHLLQSGEITPSHSLPHTGSQPSGSPRVGSGKSDGSGREESGRGSKNQTPPTHP